MTNTPKHDAEPVAKEIHFIIDGAPSHESGRLVECEDENGRSINVGRWEQRGKYWHLIVAVPPSGIAAGMEMAEICRKSKLFAQFLDQNFWHAHHVDIVWRMDGKDIVEEGDWLKNLWYAIRAAIPQVQK